MGMGLMDNQIKLFNKAYVESQVRQIKQIRLKQLKFEISESDRAFSKTLYVTFYWNGLNGKWLKGCSLRISDHLLPNEVHKTFLVEPDGFLSKKVKAKFTKALELVANDTTKKSVRKNLDAFTRQFNETKKF